MTDWNRYTALRGIPDSYHLQQLDTRPERRWPIGWGLLGAVGFGAGVIGALIMWGPR